MADVLQELLDEVRAAREDDARAKKRHERIKQLLIQVRIQRPDLKVVDIEEQIERYYDRGTISRATAAAVQAHRAAQGES